MTLLPSRSATWMTICAVRDALVGLLRHEVVITLDARLALRLAGPGQAWIESRSRSSARARLSSRPPAAGVFASPEPRRSSCAHRDAAAAIELEDRARHIVEEVAVVRDAAAPRPDRRGMPFEPKPGFASDGSMARRGARARAAREAAESDAAPLHRRRASRPAHGSRTGKASMALSTWHRDREGLASICLETGHPSAVSSE